MKSLNQIKNKQKELDDFICTKHNIDDKQRIKQAIFALDFEIAEAYNEIGFFKGWKTKPIDKEKLFEEFADNMHFIATLAYHYDIDLDLLYEFAPYQVIDFWESWLDSKTIVSKIHKMYILKDKKQLIVRIKQLIKHLFVLMRYFNYDKKQMIDSYISKYNKNIQRQKENY